MAGQHAARRHGPSALGAIAGTALSNISHSLMTPVVTYCHARGMSDEQAVTVAGWLWEAFACDQVNLRSHLAMLRLVDLLVDGGALLQVGVCSACGASAQRAVAAGGRWWHDGGRCVWRSGSPREVAEQRPCEFTPTVAAS